MCEPRACVYGFTHGFPFVEHNVASASSVQYTRLAIAVLVGVEL